MRTPDSELPLHWSVELLVPPRSVTEEVRGHRLAVLGRHREGGSNVVDVVTAGHHSVLELSDANAVSARNGVEHGHVAIAAFLDDSGATTEAFEQLLGESRLRRI